MIFSEQITEITFNQGNDIKEIIDYLNNFTFKKSDSAKIHENLCMYIFLVGCFKSSKLSFPFKVVSRESPDFTLIKTNENMEIGIEHTRATLESYKIAETELKNHPEGSVIELCRYSPYTKITKKNSDIGIVTPGGRLEGNGWSGNQVEYEWAETILNSIKNKVELLNKEHFELKNENHLFVEDDSPVDFVKHENEAIEILMSKYQQTQFLKKYIFGKIHIFSQCSLFYDIFGMYEKINLRKKELPNL